MTIPNLILQFRLFNQSGLLNNEHFNILKMPVPIFNIRKILTADIQLFKNKISSGCTNILFGTIKSLL